ncbi:MAG: hypothetical protein AAFN70_10200 [Planctomycetota bacterium]
MSRHSQTSDPTIADSSDEIAWTGENANDRSSTGQRESDAGHSSAPRRSWVFLLLSCLIIGHLWAVFSYPLQFATRTTYGEPSPSTELLSRPFRGYAEAMYLNHGYAFFAPDPGPSHLFRATITTADGKTLTRMYPDLQQQWPRLLYHRHFMLAEFLNNSHMYAVPEDQKEDDSMEIQQWKLNRDLYVALRDSFRDHLQQQYPDSEIQIERIEHLIPEVMEFRDGMEIDRRELFLVLPDRVGENAEPAYPDLLLESSPAGTDEVAPRDSSPNDSTQRVAPPAGVPDADKVPETDSVPETDNAPDTDSVPDMDRGLAAPALPGGEK